MKHDNQLTTEENTFKAYIQDMHTKEGLLYAGHLLARAARIFHDRTALIFQDQSISYHELFYKSQQLQAHLASYLHKGSLHHIAICFENSIDFYIAYFAAWQTGSVVIPLSSFLTTQEITHILQDCSPTLIITQDDKVPFFKDAQGDQHIHIISQTDMNRTYTTSLQTDLPVHKIDEHHACLLLYTSGTTGTPKGVMLSSKNIMSNVAQVISRFKFDNHEKIFGILPLFHVFAQNACIWSAFFVGATIILVHKIDRRLLLEGLTHKPTIFLGVPALYGLLCILKHAPLQSVNYFVSGGDALPDKIRTAFALIYGRKIVNGYGLTETAPVIAAEFDDELSYTNTVGKPVVGVTCSIRDKHNTEVPQGVIGQLWIHGENVMLGYYNASEATNFVLKDGWFNTGDCAYIDSYGKLIITGREKDLIINKGLNIYPQEIENTLLSFPLVIRVAVVGKPDAQEGEIPVAFIQLQKIEKNIEQKLKAFCKQNISQYKIPRLFFCDTQELPLTSTGKVDKKILREKMKSD